MMRYIEMFDLNNGVAMGNGVQNSGGAKFLTTTNGGQEWMIHTSNLDPGSLLGWRVIDFVNPDVGYYYESSSYPENLYKTTDGCQSWIEINNDIYCLVLKAYDENLLLACHYDYTSQNSFYRTSDGGSTWNVFPFINKNWGYDIEFCPGNPLKVWFNDGNGVYFSSDGGEIWTLQIGSDIPVSWAADIEFLDENNGWLLGEGGHIYKTSNGGVTTIDDNDFNIPMEFSLSQNYPNPFNPTTTIKFSIPSNPPLSPFTKGGNDFSRGGFVTLKIYDVLGNEVAILVNQYKETGEYEVEFNASGLPSGVYFYKLTAGNFSQTQKMVLIK